VEEAVPGICEERAADLGAAVAPAVEPHAPQPIRRALANRGGPGWGSVGWGKTIRISLPSFRRNVYYWGAAVLAAVIAVEAWVLVSAAPALPRADKVQSPRQQLPHPQTQSAATASAKAVPISKTTSEHRSVRAADEGYVAKNTVIRYGAGAAAADKKSLANGDSSPNQPAPHP